MTNIPPERFFEAIDATWAPAGFETSGPFRLRVGGGGGKRVSAATLTADHATKEDVAAASEAMKNLGQTPLFMLKPGQDTFDNLLDTLGFFVIDPVVVYASPVDALARHAPTGLAVIPGDIPLAAQKEIWATDDIGPARINVMERSKDPKSYLLARHDDRIAGTVFVSCDGQIGMLHALTISQHVRRKGVGKTLTYGCARWIEAQGATTLALMTTEENRPARALYEGIGMTEVTRYHYRIKAE